MASLHPYYATRAKCVTKSDSVGNFRVVLRAGHGEGEGSTHSSSRAGGIHRVRKGPYSGGAIHTEREGLYRGAIHVVRERKDNRSSSRGGAIYRGGAKIINHERSLEANAPIYMPGF